MTNGQPPGIPGLSDFEHIGSGGQGSVWRAHEATLDRDVAIKTIAAPFAGLLDLEVFERESRAIGRMSGHPNIVSVYGSDLLADPPWLKLELCRASPPSPMPVARAVEATIHVASALSSAHAVGVIHGDVKPSNILWSSFGDEPKVADFGIARLMDVTDLAHVMGSSAAYAPPEALTEGADERSDIFSLGSTLSYWLTGQRPSTPGSLDTVDPALTAIIEQARAPQAERYQSMSDFAGALQEFQRAREWPVTALRLPPTADTDEDETVLVQRLAETDVDTIARPTARAAEPTGTADSEISSGDRRIGLVVAGIAAVLVAIALAGTMLLRDADDPEESAADDSTPTTAVTTSASTPPGSAATGEDAVVEPSPATTAPGRAGTVVFASDRSGSLGIWALDLDDGTVHLLLDDGSHPSVATDGSIAYQCDSQICLRHPDGQVVTLSAPGTSSLEPAISPDGSHVVWVDRSSSGDNLVLVPTDGSSQPTPVASSSSADREPAWSPDSTLIAFRSDRTGNGDIYVHDVETGSTRRATATAEEDSSPTFLGTAIVLVRSFGGNRELISVDEEQEAVTRLTSSDAVDRAPVATLDQMHIVFESDREGSLALYLLELKSLSIERLTSHDGTDTDPVVTSHRFEQT